MVTIFDMEWAGPEVQHSHFRYFWPKGEGPGYWPLALAGLYRAQGEVPMVVIKWYDDSTPTYADVFETVDYTNDPRPAHACALQL